MRIIEPKKCRTFSDAGKIVSNIESDLCFYYHRLNSEGWYLPHNSFTHSVYWEGANRVGGRVPDYQLLWNNTGAWSAGHCSKLRMNHDQRKNLWCEVLHQRGHYKSDNGQFWVSKNEVTLKNLNTPVYSMSVAMRGWMNTDWISFTISF